MSDNLVLIVDDEQSIQETLSDVLSDISLRSIATDNAVEALKLIESENPSLVLLDIWLPGMDGMEALKKIKELSPDLPVVMISGHATISTAVKATQLGAADFIEKPLDLDRTIQAVKKAISPVKVETIESDHSVKYDSSVFDFLSLSGKERPQKTLASSSVMYGVGVHSGSKSGLVLEPLPENSGIHFAGIDSELAAPAHLDFVTTTGFATTIKNQNTQVSTIEHLMSALHAAGITNLLVKCNQEVPVMDGSAIEFCKIINEIGIKEQSATVPEIAVTETLQVGDGEEFIRIEPHDSFVIDYTLSYPEPIGVQQMTFELNDFQEYEREIAPCRTFGFVKDIAYLQQQGLAQGGRFNNFVLIGDDGAINSELRFSDEQVRHKILDAIGDLYLLGRPIVGKITAKMTGHSDNIQLLGKILELMRS